MTSSSSRTARSFLSVVVVAVLEANTGSIWAQAEETTSTSECKAATAALLSAHGEVRDASSDFAQRFSQSCALGDILSSQSSSSNNADVCGFSNRFGKSSVTANACVMTDYDSLSTTLQETCQDPATGGMYCTMSVDLTGAIPLSLFGSPVPVNQNLVGNFECLGMCVSKDKCKNSQEALVKLAMEKFVNDFGSALVGVDLSKFETTPTLDCILIDDPPAPVVGPANNEPVVPPPAVVPGSGPKPPGILNGTVLPGGELLKNATNLFDEHVLDRINHTQTETEAGYDNVMNRINQTNAETEAALLEYLSSAGSRTKAFPVLALALISGLAYLFE